MAGEHEALPEPVTLTGDLRLELDVALRRPTCDFRWSHDGRPAGHVMGCTPDCGTVTFLCCECNNDIFALYQQGAAVACAKCGCRDRSLQELPDHDGLYK